jgi:hypothetical protein
MLLVVLGEILMGLLAYRRAKKDGTLPEPEVREPYVSKPLRPDATRIERIAHWFGLEETPD